MALKRQLIKLHHLFSDQLGFDPLRLLSFFRGVPRYLSHLYRFRKGFNGKLALAPSVHDWYEEGGSTKSEYFWQDLLVAKMIFEARPERHVDVGSRVDGFVAHVASFREIEVFDVRPISTKIPNVMFKQVDFMQSTGADLPTGYCDSLSCLHAIEHFGLGRYGDPIDPLGYEHAIANMARILKPDGCLYLSTPIGQERVEFDSNRVFDPQTIIRCAESNGLILQELTTVDAGSDTVNKVPLHEHELLMLSKDHYKLGMFIFTKMSIGDQKR